MMKNMKSALLACAAALGVAGALSGCAVPAGSGTLSMAALAPTQEVKRIGWDTTPIAYRGKVGQVLRYECPAPGSDHTVYGTDTYTDNSSICTAAVHAGKISKQAGGLVTIQMQGPNSQFAGTTRNGVKSETWDFEIPGTFIFLGGSQPIAFGQPAEPAAFGREISWTETAGALRGQVGQTFRFVCPSSVVSGYVYGTGIYTDDSSICTAAVHAGRINRQTGGLATIRILDGLSFYSGSTANGVVSSNWNGPWAGSFEFVS